MAIQIIDGHVNVDGEIKNKGAKLKMKDAEEKRLVNLGYAKFIDEKDEIENVEDEENDDKKDSKKAGK